MIGIDTNILVRLLTRDDERQFQQAAVLIDSLSDDEPGFVSLVVVAELVWVLQYVYQTGKPEMLAMLHQLIRTRTFSFQNVEVILLALRHYEKTLAEFTDSLIVEIARHAHCSEIYTFDHKAAKRANMRLLS